MRDVILGRLTRRYAGEGRADTLAACARLLESAPDTPNRQRLLAALDEGLPDDLPAENVPAELVARLASLWSDDTADPTLIRLLARLRKELMDRVLAMLEEEDRVFVERNGPYPFRP